MPDAAILFAQQVAGSLPGGAEQPDLLQARQMQALSLGVHIPLVCFGIAFPAMFLFVEGLYLRTGDPLYKSLAKRWSKVALVLFAVGVVTGTILSFEMGLLWPQFMANFGSVFGFAFGLEGIFFFLEAIFLAIYVYGWDRFPRRQHLLLGLPVAIAGIGGSFCVISVNGWMNHPEGFKVVGGKVVDPAPLDAFFNANVWHEEVHMYLAGYIVAGFIVAGVYAWGWLHGRRDRYHRIALTVSLAFACLAAPCQLIVGDWAGRSVAARQPIKLAAFEGVYETASGAPITIGGWYDEATGEVKYGIQLPKGLSLLAYHDPNATVRGLQTVSPSDRPPVNVVRFAFQAMVGIGTLLALVAAVFLVTWLRFRRLPRSAWFHRVVVIAGPLAIVALISGWITTEVGRQPWIAYQVMRTSQAVTSVDGLSVGYAFLVAVYVALGAAVVWLLRRFSRRPEQVAADG